MEDEKRAKEEAKAKVKEEKRIEAEKRAKLKEEEAARKEAERKLKVPSKQKEIESNQKLMSFFMKRKKPCDEDETPINSPVDVEMSQMTEIPVPQDEPFTMNTLISRLRMLKAIDVESFRQHRSERDEKKTLRMVSICIDGSFRRGRFRKK